MAATGPVLETSVKVVQAADEVKAAAEAAIPLGVLLSISILVIIIIIHTRDSRSIPANYLPAKVNEDLINVRFISLALKTHLEE